ncbi:MAG: hypothetical protein OEM97_03060, partial [Acidimicrobiia bacterium]|nr:hypothetical protein [Acidimicrobiia bacterium]
MDELRIRDLFTQGSRLIGRFVRRHPISYALAVLGAALFVSSIIASALVIGRVTEELIIPVLDNGVSSQGRLLGALIAVMVVAAGKAIGIVMRRIAAGYLQFRSRIDIRRELLEHQFRLETAWF